VAALLRGGPWELDVRYIGHRSAPLTAAALAQAVLYAQPGGGELEPAYRHLREHRREIREFVAGGGGYLGFCLGGYLAGATPGFGLLPGDTDRYIGSKRATVTHHRDTVVDVRWRDRPRALFFQDGPRFLLDAAAHATVLARYPNEEIAAVVVAFGRGRVGVVGPHPEATSDWFIDAGLPLRDNADLGRDLVDTVLRPEGAVRR
jgi:glutamine amidotransferase-like uncharacterized protein